MPRRRLRKNTATQGRQGSLGEALSRICGRNFNAVTSINFVVMACYYLMFVTGTEYVRNNYGVSLSVAGLTSGVMVIGSLVGRFFCGNFISLTGCRRLLLGGIVLYAFSIGLLFLPCSLVMIFVCRVLAGFGVGICGTVTATVAAHAIPGADKGLGISFFSLSTALALALGPFAGIVLMQNYGYRITLSCTLLAVSLMSPLALLVLEPPALPRRARPLRDLKSYIDPRVLPFGLVVLLVFLGYGCLQAFMATFAQERNIASVSSLFFLVYSAAVVTSRPFSGRQMDFHGENRVLYPLFLIIALAFCLMAFTYEPVLFMLCALLFGLGFGNFQSIGQAVPLTLVTPSRFAQATTTFFICMDLGIGLGPYLFGFIVTQAGYSGMFLALGATTLATMLLYSLLYARHARYK